MRVYIYVCVHIYIYIYICRHRLHICVHNCLYAICTHSVYIKQIFKLAGHLSLDHDQSLLLELSLDLSLSLSDHSSLSLSLPIAVNSSSCSCTIHLDHDACLGFKADLGSGFSVHTLPLRIQRIRTGLEAERRRRRHPERRCEKGGALA